MPTVDLGQVVGPQGPQGATGATGPQGAAGPNEVSTSTATALSGVLFGNGSTVEAKALDAVGGVASSANMAKAFSDLAPTEASSTAADTHAVGTYLTLNGKLYRVTVAIAIGDTITDTGGSANVTEVTVGGEFNSGNPYIGMVAAANAVKNAGVAPGGFGLGTQSVLLTGGDDLNTITANGVYRFDYNSMPQHAPTLDDLGYTPSQFILVVTNFNETVPSVFQTIYMVDADSYGVKDYHMQRAIYGSSTTPWKWENPRLIAGVPYCTTEWYLGKPVYQQVLDFGDVSAVRSYTYAIQNVDDLVDAHAIIASGGVKGQILNDNNEMPAHGAGFWKLTSYIDQGTLFVTITCTTAASSANAKVILKYTKT